MKKVLLIGLCTVLLLGVGCDKGKKQNDPTDPIPNENSGVVKDQTFSGLTFTNTSLVYDNGTSILTATFTNSTSADITLNTFNVIVKDENGNVVVKLVADATGIIKPGDSKQLSVSVDMDLSTKAYTIEYAMME